VRAQSGAQVFGCTQSAVPRPVITSTPASRVSAACAPVPLFEYLSLTFRARTRARAHTEAALRLDAPAAAQHSDRACEARSRITTSAQDSRQERATRVHAIVHEQEERAARKLICMRAHLVLARIRAKCTTSTLAALQDEYIRAHSKRAAAQLLSQGQATFQSKKLCPAC
jgi:hypothetical protein